MGHVASSGEGRGRLGDATDGRARGDVPRRPRNGFGRRRCHYCEPCVTGRNREKRGRENDMWGPRVRFDFHLISNFWIVTASTRVSTVTAHSASCRARVDSCYINHSIPTPTSSLRSGAEVFTILAGMKGSIMKARCPRLRVGKPAAAWPAWCPCAGRTLMSTACCASSPASTTSSTGMPSCPTPWPRWADSLLHQLMADALEDWSGVAAAPNHGCRTH